MAFEVFDDGMTLINLYATHHTHTPKQTVAFYWFLQVLLGITLLPITLYRIRDFFTFKHKLKTRAHPFVNSVPDYIPKIKLVSEEDKSVDSTLSLKNIFFAFSWILFLLLLIQLPKWHNREMTSFEPYDVLEIAKGSSESQIKRAYRKMSLKYHPDKCTKEPLNLPDAKCKDMFILVRKAYETLTDEATKDNYEKYGNPDGYKGTSVTIGLPSWLQHKDNELVILSVYFIALIVLVTVVWSWWNHSNKFHKSGVYKRSIEIFWRFIKQDMRLRHLLDILSASAEYRMLDVVIPNDSTHPKYKAFEALEHEILNVAKKRGGANPNRQTLDNVFNASYARKAAALLHAHLMGMQIPTQLYAEYMIVLQEAPRLLDVMIDMTVSRERFWAQTMQLIQLKQAIIQGVWPMESHLKQLPHWTPAIDKGVRKNGYQSILALNFLKEDELNETLKKVYSEYSEDHSHLISPLKEDDNALNDDIEFSASATTTSSSKDKKKQKKKYGNKGKGGRKNKGKNRKSPNKKKQSTENQKSNQSKDTNADETSDQPTTGQNGHITTDDEETATKTTDDEQEQVTENESEVESPKAPTQTIEKETPKKAISSTIKDDILPPGALADPSEVLEMTQDATACIRMYPFVKMLWCARTYDEDEIYNEDIVKVSVHLDRIEKPWEYDIKSFQFVEKMEPPEKDKQFGEKKNEYDDEHGLDFVDNELAETRRLQIARLSAPVVHVNKFPFRIREKWLVMLVDLQSNIVIDQRAVPDLSGMRKVDLHFRANKPRTGKYPYRLVVKCDSYLGADKHVTFEVLINCDHDKRGSNERLSSRDDESEKSGYNIPDEEEDTSEPKWYLLWNETFWEFLLTLFLLYFMYLVVMSSSWGKKYLQPYMDWISNRFIYPLNDVATRYANDYVIGPISRQVLKELGVDLIKWWYQIEDDEHDNSGIDEDDVLSDEDEAYFNYANDQFKQEV